MKPLEYVIEIDNHDAEIRKSNRGKLRLAVTEDGVAIFAFMNIEIKYSQSLAQRKIYMWQRFR